ncbi:MAG: bifunctional DNA-formamidopyrimidine glycosylase/DNA-(apurinic or apyrimidinic site) lyase [Candidatus Dadabacteria bacterium]|nr:MAG: bifunctional DNA-formamidopyrimidine glycosylase/DNA-(apurinic or apyrimidinic site) lyase [Candidatus Dadabacteria bacterium]
MPELPEVETIARSLAPVITGRTIAETMVWCRQLRGPVPAGMDKRLGGRTIERIWRRGKFLVLDFGEPPALILHLGMTGRLLLATRSDPTPAFSHEHVRWLFDDGTALCFIDPRRFGLVALADPGSSPLLSDLGPEPFDRRFSGRYLVERRRGSRRPVKDALMDQRLVAGIGNIYANEILFHAGIRPRRRFGRLSRRECDALAVATRRVLREAIAHRGTTIADFLDGIGRRGGYQWRRRVYDREGQPCPRCRTAIKRVVVAQRATYYCPRCQR